MKTTIDVPDDLLVKAKVLAAEQRTTLRDLVVRGLQLVTETDDQNEAGQRREALKRLLLSMRAENTEPMVPVAREDLHER